MFTIPEGVTSGIAAVTVTTFSGGTSSPVNITIIDYAPPPIIDFIASASGGATTFFSAGEAIGVIGSNLCENPCDLSRIIVRIGAITIPIVYLFPMLTRLLYLIFQITPHQDILA